MSGLRLELAPSPRLAAAILVLHACAAGAVLALLRDVRGWLLACALLALGFAAARSKALHRSPGSIRAIELAAGEFRVTLTGGASFVVPAPQRRYVTRWLVALPLGGALAGTLLVTRDMLGEDSFRRLRIWAIWGKLPRAVALAQLPA